MRSVALALILLLFIQLSAFAAEEYLTLQMEILKDSRSVYSSVTDLYNINIFTPESMLQEKEYQIYTEAVQQRSLDGLFSGTPVITFDEETYIQDRATALHLFLDDTDQKTYLRTQNQDAQNLPDVWLIAAVIGLLCVGAFLFSNWRYKRKKGRAIDVHNGYNENSQ